MEKALGCKLLVVTVFAATSCAGYRANSFIVENEGTVLSSSEPRARQFLLDFAASDLGARTVLDTQGMPDYIFVERQSIFRPDILKFAYINENRTVILTRSATQSTAAVETGISKNIVDLFTFGDRARLAQIRAAQAGPQGDPPPEPPTPVPPLATPSEASATRTLLGTPRLSPTASATATSEIEPPRSEDQVDQFLGNARREFASAASNAYGGGSPVQGNTQMRTQYELSRERLARNPTALRLLEEFYKYWQASMGELVPFEGESSLHYETRMAERAKALADLHARIDAERR